VKQNWEQALAEVLGTFALVFIGAGSVVILGASPNAAGLLGIALAHGLVLAIMISNFGHISGGHFNPAVTVSVWVAGKIETLRAGWYIFAQLVGAAAGALLLRAALPKSIWNQTNLGATTVGHRFGITNGKAVLIEAVLTFFLVLTVFAVAIDDRGVFKALGGVPIGLVLTFDILFGGLLTGASMNPARSFGPALASGTWTDYWVYLVGPFAGGILAAAVYWFGFLRGRTVAGPTTEMPIGGGPDEGFGDELDDEEGEGSEPAGLGESEAAGPEQDEAELVPGEAEGQAVRDEPDQA
jgi:MIP family channel proteins